MLSFMGQGQLDKIGKLVRKEFQETTIESQQSWMVITILIFQGFSA